MFRLHLVVNFTVCTRSSITFPASPPPFLSPVCSYLESPSGVTIQKHIMICTSPCVLIVVCPSREKRYVAKWTERTPIMHCACSVNDAMCLPSGIVTLHSCIVAELQCCLAGPGSVLELSGVSLKSIKGWRLLHLLTFETPPTTPTPPLHLLEASTVPSFLSPY